MVVLTLTFLSYGGALPKLCRRRKRYWSGETHGLLIGPSHLEYGRGHAVVDAAVSRGSFLPRDVALTGFSSARVT